MGVRTKYWGPHAWRVLHALARALDAQPDWARPATQEWVWSWLPDLLPCVHCRHSTRRFLSQDLRRHPVGQRSYAERLHALHAFVNTKLFRQEVVAAQRQGDPLHLARVVGRWAGYQPSLAQTQAAALALDSREFVTSLTFFLYYIVCDAGVVGAAEGQAALLAFWDLLEDVLPAALSWTRAWAPPKGPDRATDLTAPTLETRLAAVQAAHAALNTTLGAPAPLPLEFRRAICDRAIVQC